MGVILTISIDRNNKGQFVKGHKPISSRDPKTGRFIKIDSIENKVDLLLSNRSINHVIDP